MSKAKAQGTAVETAAVIWLRDYGFPRTRRVTLSGSCDQGDLLLRTRPTVIAECKRAQRGVQLTPWMREVDTEVTNSEAAFGLLIAKQRGAGDRSVSRWFAAMRLAAFEALVQLAGDPPWVDVVSWSPVRINSLYVPRLLGPETRSRSWPGTGPLVPFASTFAPGNPDVLTVCGPLEQFAALLRQAQLGDDE